MRGTIVEHRLERAEVRLLVSGTYRRSLLATPPATSAPPPDSNGNSASRRCAARSTAPLA
ncbi:hypothetical protein [Amycolatopsis marina]|uniref:hypothetical protein n=1 Tax=Amycolatopsis marina TaxID=490629 RepID=UPI000B87B7E0|nr:hypothetical protein [Amycolatopsis marina]